MAIGEKIKNNLLFYFFILILFFLLYYFINIFSYFNLPNLCYISLEKDTLNGNKETLHQAIGLLKKTNREDYKNLCRYVDTISEKYCFAFDPRTEGREDGAWQPGCFAKGSKTIYLKPAKEKSDLIIERRSAEIRKFMLMSKAYWESKK